MSEDSSGGVCSSAVFTALTILCSGSAIADKTSSELIMNERGTPSAKLRPRTSISTALPSLNAIPTSFLIFSAVVSPITQPCALRA